MPSRSFSMQTFFFFSPPFFVFCLWNIKSDHQLGWLVLIVVCSSVCFSVPWIGRASGFVLFPRESHPPPKSVRNSIMKCTALQRMMMTMTGQCLIVVKVQLSWRDGRTWSYVASGRGGAHLMDLFAPADDGNYPPPVSALYKLGSCYSFSQAKSSS